MIKIETWFLLIIWSITVQAQIRCFSLSSVFFFALFSFFFFLDVKIRFTCFSSTCNIPFIVFSIYWNKFQKSIFTDQRTYDLKIMRFKFEYIYKRRLLCWLCYTCIARSPSVWMAKTLELRHNKLQRDIWYTLWRAQQAFCYVYWLLRFLLICLCDLSNSQVSFVIIYILRFYITICFQIG